MKRCPQCDFVYENDQSLCDMDGRDLIHVPKSRPLSENEAPIAASAPSTKSRWRKYVVLAVAGIILGAVLFPVYYVSTHQAAPHNNSHTSVKVTSPSPQSAPGLALATSVAPPIPTATKSPVSRVKATNRVTPKTAYSSAPVMRPTLKPSLSPKPKSAEMKTKPGGGNKKKESKLGLILKKAGRMLKKPF